MRIKQLDIYGYGKWVDQRFDLNEGLQVFLGKNEAGKSTLMSFIHSILFGFPTRNSTFLRYEPQESSKYGGRIIAEDRLLGEVIIERVHGKVTGDVTVTLEDGTTGSEELLNQLLKGLSRENFQSIYSFSLSDIENVHQLDKSKLSRYLLNIGAHSTDYYLTLVDDFQKNAYDLYRPSGRIPPLNKQLSAILTQEKKLEQLEKRNQSYIELIKEEAKQTDRLKEIEKKSSQLEDQLNYLKEFKKELSVLREIQSLKKEIAKTHLPFLKKDGPYLLDEYKNEITEAERLLEEISESIKSKETAFLKPELMETYQENKKDILSLEQELPETIEELSQLETIEKKLKENKEQLFELEQLLKIHKQNTRPSSFTAKEQLMVADWQESYNQLKSKIEFSTFELEEIENQLNLKNQKADQYEELMWQADYFKEIENQLQLNEEPEPIFAEEKTSSLLLPVATGLVGLIALFGSFLTSAMNQWLLAGVAVLFLLLSFLFYRKATKKVIKELPRVHSSDNLLMNEYEKQLRIQSDWQILLGEIDAIQADYQAKKEAQSVLLKKQKEFDEKWRMLLISKSLPTIHSFEDAKSVMTQTKELNYIQGTNESLGTTKTKLVTALEQKMSVIDKVLMTQDDLTIVEKTGRFRLYLKELNHLLETEESKITELNALKEKQKQLIAHKEIVNNKNKQLLEASGVETEEEFRALYIKKQKLEQKKSRVQFLEENAPAFDSDKPLPSREELSKKEENILQKLHEQQKQSKEIINQRANIQVNIKNLEKDGSYSEALQEFENQKASTQKLVDEWISDKIAASVIQDTLNKVTQERFEEIMTEINEYFNFLTDGEYENILFKEDELFVQKKDGSVMEVKALSRGTAEPLYVAIRLAYIVKMEDVIRLPIVIDDPFVNFDKKRKENIYRLLDELSDKLQIIYFSFDTDLRDEFSDTQIIKLEKYNTLN